ncbi:MAG: TIGR01620 family protein [Hyphomicrobiales bacterium]|nr:MAG: TIGR01620 family protein [Hyphomicrobiales bacterium]
MTDRQRKPTAFRLDDPDVVITAAAPAETDALIALAEADLAAPPAPPMKRRFRWSSLFFSALGGLISLGVGLAVDQLIRDLFSRADWLGWLGIGLAALALLAALAIVLRELFGIWRLNRIDRLRTTADAVIEADDRAGAIGLVRNVSDLYANRPDTARGRAAIAQRHGEIIDGADLVRLAERDLFAPLDARARRLVIDSAKRVSVVTAISPRAVVDVLFVFVESLRLIRRVSDLYGGRPGGIGFMRLARHVIGHLAVTGSIAIGDSLVQQLVGHGLAAKLSARLGEGVINGMLTARIGLAAIDVCRPLPFAALNRPRIGDVLSELMKSADADGNDKSKPGR